MGLKDKKVIINLYFCLLGYKREKVYNEKYYRLITPEVEIPNKFLKSKELSRVGQ